MMILTSKVCKTTYFLVCDQGSLVGLRIQDYKCLCAVVTICAIPVTVQRHIQTAFWPAYTNRAARWAKIDQL